MRTMITGGVKSGKSTYALEIARSEFGARHFLATAIAFDDEMRDKIDRHKDERAGEFSTVEEPFEIDKALRNDMIVDCLPMWLNNCFFAGRKDSWRQILERFVAALPLNIVIVTNETGLGTIPMDRETREWNAALGEVNKTVARACDRVVLMVSGVPVAIKGTLK